MQQFSPGISDDGYSYIPLLRLSPFNLPDGERLHMALKAYYDSSGKIQDPPSQRFLTLAGLAASENVWPPFETAWKEMLARSQMPYLHTSEVMGRWGPFSAWDEAKLKTFVYDLLGVWEEYAHKGLQSYSCCVVREDYRKAQEKLPVLKDKPIEAFCVDHCVGGLLPTSEGLAGYKPITLYFDRDEPFKVTIEQVWNKAKFHTHGWPAQVAGIVAVDMKDTYPIQAADFLAWIVNRQHTKGDHNILYDASFLLDHRAWFYDYDGLKRYDEQKGIK